MDMNIRSNHNNSDEFTREWRNLTSQHVLQFWLSFGESSLFHLGRVVTTFVEEARVPTPTTDNSKNDDIIDNSNNANANNNAGSSETIPTNEDLLFDNDPQDRATANRPDPLVIVYQQEIFFLPKNHEVENYPELTKSDLFTIPFKQDARSYTDKLRIISNNTHIVFMEYNGVVSNPSPPSTSSHGTNVIVIVVSVVLSVLVAVTGFILYLMRRKIYENHLKATVAAAVLAQQQQHQQEPSSHIEMEKPQSEFDLLLVVSIVDARIPNNENVDDYVHISESYENGILDATDHPEDRKLEMENGGALGPPDDDETLHPGPSNRHLLSLDSMHHHESVPMGDVEINDASVSKTMSHGIMMLGGDATTNINDEIFVARREHLSTEDSVAFPPSLLLTASDLENGDWRSPEQPFIHCNPTNTSSNHIHHHPHSNNYDDAQYTPDHSYGSGSSLDNPDDENYTNNDGDIPSTQQYSSSPFVSYNPVGESPVLAMDDVKEVLTEDVIQQDSSEDPHIPFMMAGFQLEIHDLE